MTGMRHSDADEAGQEEQTARARNKMSISGRRISVMGVGEVESQSKVHNEIEKPKVRQLIIAIPSALNDSLHPLPFLLLCYTLSIATANLLLQFN